MESNIPFEQILEHFLNGPKYYFISENETTILDSVTPEKVRELAAHGQVCIPKKTAVFDKKIKEAFVYEITDTKLAEKLFESVMGLGDSKPFEQLVNELGLTERWTLHLRKSATNALINWMVKTNITLPGQTLAQDVTIQPIELSAIPDEMKTFLPTLCRDCKNTIGFAVKHFKTSLPCENMMMENNVAEQLTAQGYPSFQFLGREKKEMIAASQPCHRCGKPNLDWGFT